MIPSIFSDLAMMPHIIEIELLRFWARGLLTISSSGVDPRKDLPKDAGHPKTHTAGMIEIADMIPQWAVGCPASINGRTIAISFDALHHRPCSRLSKKWEPLEKTIQSHFASHRHLISMRALTLWRRFHLDVLHKEFAITASIFDGWRLS
jgi:hypothetical protein